MTQPRKKVLMFVLNELIYDARVLKSAQSISSRYDVLLIGIWRRKFDFDQEAEKGKWPFQMAWVDLGKTSKAPRNIFGHGIKYLQAFRGIRSLGIGFQPDLIHAHDFNSLPIARSIQKATRARLIYDAHELYRDAGGFSTAMLRILGSIETNIMKNCDGIIACNSPRAKIMYEDYGAPFLPTVIPNMPNFRGYEPSTLLQEITKSTTQGISRLVLYQGVIMPGRGLAMLPKALKSLPGEYGMVLMGAGEKSYIDRLGEKAKRLGVGQRFFILPPVPQSQLFRYTCSADVGIVIYQNKTRNDYYCAPNKLYEYTAAGVPMVGSDLPTIKQFIEDEGVGFIFSPESHEDLARAIQEVYNSEKTYPQFSETCKKLAPTCSWESNSEIMLQSLYEDLLG
jgi:glycosyltransferase involved in cell wall biosynthesis